MKHLPLSLLAVLLCSCSSFWRWEPIDGGGAGGSGAVQRRAGPGEYQVQRGDTVYSIAFRNSLDYRSLAAWNGISGNYLIYPGQILRLRPPNGSTGGGSNPPIVASRSSGTGNGNGASARTVVVKPTGTSTAPVPTGPYNWRWPASGTVLRGFALPASKGLDITDTLGAPVYAAAPGRVVYSGSALKGYGELIIVKHDETYLSAYGYNRRRLVEEGDAVTGGQQIGEIGMGPESRPVLHFEIRRAGQPVNPSALLPAR